MEWTHENDKDMDRLGDSLTEDVMKGIVKKLNAQKRATGR
jgi:hypothetical protein